MTTNVETTSSGSGFLTLLALLFIALKLTDVIDWSWWWVLSPLWIPMVFACVVIAIMALVWAVRK